MSGKRCVKCKVFREMSSFVSLQHGGETGACSICRATNRRLHEKHTTKESRAIAHKRWRERNPDRHKRHKRNGVLKKYGITVEDYDQLLLSQEGKCACCKQHITKGHVDHNHATKQVRGILCPQCNTGLGMFNDDIDRLKMAVRYLE